MKHDYDWYFDIEVDFACWFVGLAFDTQAVYLFIGPLAFTVQWV